MPTLSDLRQKYPQYNDMSDGDFAGAFHSKFYSDIPQEDFYRRIGYTTGPDLSPTSETGSDVAGAVFQQGLGDIGRLAEELGKGVAKGFTSTIGGLYGTAGTLGRIVGADDFAARQEKVAQGLAQATQATPSRVERVEDISGPEDFAMFAAGQLGSQVAPILSLLTGAGVGAGVGKVTAELMAKGLTPQLAKQAVMRGTLKGTALGSFAAGTTIETGATAQEQIQVSGKVSDPWVALTAGAAKGALDSVLGTVVARNLGISGHVTSTFLDHLKGTTLAAAGKLGIVEMTTEALQEMIDLGARKWVDDNFDVVGPEAASRLLNAAASGALLGGALGATVGAPRPLEPGKSRVPPSDTNGLFVHARKYEFGEPLSEKALQNRSFIDGDGGYYVFNGEVFLSGKGPVDYSLGMQNFIDGKWTELSPLPGILSEDPRLVQGELAKLDREGGLTLDAEERRTSKEFWDNWKGQHAATQTIRDLFDVLPMENIAPSGPTSAVAPRTSFSPILNASGQRQAMGANLGGNVKTTATTTTVPVNPNPALSQQAQLNPPPTQNTLNTIAAQTDKLNWNMRWLYNVYQIANRNQHIGELQTYTQLLDEWNVDKMRTISRGEQRVNDWQKTGQTQQISNYLFAIDRMDYLAAGEKPRQPTQAEADALAHTHGLSAASKTVAEGVRKDFSDMLDTMQELREMEATQSITDPIQLNTRLQEIAQEFTGLRQRPYMPHARFGKYAVAVADPAGNLVDFQTRETQIGQRRLRAELEKAYPGHSLRVTTLSGQEMTFRGLPPTMIKAVAGKLNLSATQQAKLQDIIYESSPGRSVLKRFTHREGIAGYSPDGLRAYADTMFHMANHVARARYSGRMEGSIADLRKTERTMPDGNTRVAIADYMQRHYDYAMNPQNELQGLRSLGFMFHLGWAVDSAAINLTQVPLVTYPFLAARFKDTGAIAEISKSYAHVRDLYRKGPNAHNAQMGKFVDEGIAQGFLDESQAVELAALSEPGIMDKVLGPKGRKVAHTVQESSVFLFREAERMNRRVSFSAGVQLALNDPTNPYVLGMEQRYQLPYNDMRKRGWTPEEARAFLVGKDTVNETQFQFSRHARPEALRGKPGAALLFFNYPINMLRFLTKDPGKWRYLAILLAVGGLKGLPFAQDANAFSKLLLELAEKVGLRSGRGPFDPLRETQRFVAELSSATTADYVMNGAGRGMGYFDVSARVGMGRLSPLDLENIASNVTGAGDYKDLSFDVAEGVLGASASPAIGLMKGVTERSPDMIKRWEPALPRALRNVTKAARMARDGALTSKDHAKLVTFDMDDPHHLTEVVGQAMGFTPQRVSRYWDLHRMKQEHEGYWKARQTAVLARVWGEVASGRGLDPNTMQDLVGDFNANVPIPALMLNKKTLVRSLQRRNLSKMRREAGVSQNRKYTPLYQELDAIFGVPEE